MASKGVRWSVTPVASRELAPINGREGDGRESEALVHEREERSVGEREKTLVLSQGQHSEGRANSGVRGLGDDLLESVAGPTAPDRVAWRSLKNLTVTLKGQSVGKTRLSGRAAHVDRVWVEEGLQVCHRITSVGRGKHERSAN